jgi:hypothetical protein
MFKFLIKQFSKKKYNRAKIYNEEFIYNLFKDKNIEKYLALNYNIDKCLLNEDSLNNVKILILVHG